ncbi:MAG: 1-(5-phosphoribosyl)-5-amino-4-imidazole-carboxylate carboxylase, partial [Schlesneria sp.]
MSHDSLEVLLHRWQSGEWDVAQLESVLRKTFEATKITPEVQIDIDRERRCGYPEVVYGPGKSPEAIRDVFRVQQAAGQNSLATRVTADQAQF